MESWPCIRSWQGVWAFSPYRPGPLGHGGHEKCRAVEFQKKRGHSHSQSGARCSEVCLRICLSDEVPSWCNELVAELAEVSHIDVTVARSFMSSNTIKAPRIRCDPCTRLEACLDLQDVSPRQLPLPPSSAASPSLEWRSSGPGGFLGGKRRGSVSPAWKARIRML